jgi:NTP pyrophosphatase (non-canonical NTP hydrolase)
MDLGLVAVECRRNSERWFPGIHDASAQLIPLKVYYALALMGEAGEICDAIKKHHLRTGELDADPDQLRQELADVFTYLLLLADEWKVDLWDAFLEKQAICEERWG